MRLPGRSSTAIACLGLLLGAALLFGAGQPAPPPPKAAEGAFGAMRGTAEELGDIVEPPPEEEWEALR